MSNESHVVTLHHGVIKFGKNRENNSPCYTFYTSGDIESNQNIVLYKTHFNKFMTCLQLNFDTVVSQALECDKEHCYKNNQTMLDDEDNEKEELLDMQVISEWNHTAYVPCRIVLKSSIYKGKFRLWVLKQWYKRPEYDVNYLPESTVYFTNVDDLSQENWLPCKGAFRIEPLQKELKALMNFHARCNGNLNAIKPKKRNRKQSTRLTPQEIAEATAVEKDVETEEEEYEEEMEQVELNM